MKPNMRWQLLFAVIGLGLVMALLSYHVQSENRLCTARFPASGGAFVEGMLGSPEHINPLLVDSNPVDRQLSELIFDGLTRYEGGELVPALAESWQISDDGRTLRFDLRDDVQWHDGEPFTAADVAFTYSLMQHEDFPGDQALQRLWQTVVIREVASDIIEFELREPYAGFLDATTTGILPAHILGDVPAGELGEHDFNHNPVGTGPFAVPAGQNWEATQQLDLQPVPDFWPQGTRVGAITFRFFASEQALTAAFSAGDIQAINQVLPSMLPNVAEDPDARLFSAPAYQYSSLLFNLGEGGAQAVQSLDVRRALARGLGRDKIIDGALNGQGVAHHGPYLPQSWAYQPELLTPYSTDVISATAELENGGWLWPEGAEMREKDGEGLTLRFLVYDTPTHRAVASAIEEQWKELGVATLITYFTSWGDFRQALRDGRFDVALAEIQQEGDPDLYDFWSQEAIVRGQNFAGWNRRRASEALESGRMVWPVSERKPFYSAFLRYYDEDLPELALYQHIYTYAVSGAVEGVEIGRIDEPRDRYESLGAWVTAYQELSVLCPEDKA